MRVCAQHAVDFIRLHHFLGCQSQQLQCYVPSSHAVISLAQGRQWSMMFMLLSPLLLLLHQMHLWYKLLKHYENNNVLWSRLLIMIELFSNCIFNVYLISIITSICIELPLSLEQNQIIVIRSHQRCSYEVNSYTYENLYCFRKVSHLGLC